LLGSGSAQEEKTAREKNGPAAAAVGEAAREERIPFLFLFRIFKSIFQMIFKSNLNLIQTTQHKTPNAAA
jgi:hypothetical protein